MIQTITTVGYGDMVAESSSEKTYRIACMILGVVMMNILTTNLVEIIVIDTINIYRYTDHENKIEKLQHKYDIKGYPKKLLNLLGDSI